MNHKNKRLPALILAALMLATVPVQAAEASYAPEIEETGNKISATQAEIDALNAQLKEKEKEREANKAAIAELEKQSALTLEKKYLLDSEMIYLLDQIEITEDIIAKYEASIATKKAEIASTEASIAEKKELFTEHLRNEYEQGSSKIKYLELLFNSSSIGDFFTNLHYVTSMMDYEQHLIKEMETLITRLESQTAELNTSLSEQEVYKAELTVDLAEVEELNKQTEAYMAQLMADEEMYIKFNEELDEESSLIANEIDQKAEAYESLVETQEALKKKEEERLEAIKKAEEERIKAEEEAKRREEEEAKKNETSSNQTTVTQKPGVSSAGIAYDNNSLGRWQWPVDYNKAKWTSPYGTRVDPVTGKKNTWHNGIDLALPKGNNIYAVDAGVVITSEYHRSYGNYVVVLHDNGYKTLYAHASKLLVEEGDQVAQGTVLALVGTTGKSTGNHLHFTVYKPGSAKKDVNPFSFYPTLSDGLKLYD